MKQQILELAVQQLGRGGYTELSFAKIADTLGISRANIHHHYNSKKKLAEAAIKYFVAERNKLTLDALEEANYDLFEVTKAFDLYLRESIKTDDFGFCVCSSFLTESDKVPDDLKQLCIDAYREEYKLFVDLIKQGQEEGAISTSRTAEDIETEFRLLKLGYIQLAKSKCLGADSPFQDLEGLFVRWARNLYTKKVKNE